MLFCCYSPVKAFPRMSKPLADTLKDQPALRDVIAQSLAILISSAHTDMSLEGAGEGEGE